MTLIASVNFTKAQPGIAAHLETRGELRRGGVVNGGGRGAMRTNGINVRPAERIRSSKKIDTREATAAADTIHC